MASNGHFLTQIPQPIHNSSEIEAILSLGVTSMQSLPIRTTGQDFLHSCRHLLGLHRSLFTMAILVRFSVSSASFRFNFGGILNEFQRKICEKMPPVYTCFVSFSAKSSICWELRLFQVKMSLCLICFDVFYERKSADWTKGWMRS